ncbi:MAG: hypothetical protein ABW169_02340 [Sphingobium sp.]|jgi:hypothetical protein
MFAAIRCQIAKSLLVGALPQDVGDHCCKEFQFAEMNRGARHIDAA